MRKHWKESLDESVWPQIWATRDLKIGKIDSLFNKDELSQRQLRYMHIYLYYNEQEAKMHGKRPYWPRTVEAFCRVSAPDRFE